MALDREFAQAFVTALASTGWHAPLPAGNLPNPLDITFYRDSETLRLILHARRITRQARSGANPSTHHRPSGEMHTQMIFEGDRRGSGVKNTLRFVPNAKTLLFGFYPTDVGYVIAAYDPQRHHEYAYSKSLQVKEFAIRQALTSGIAFQTRSSDETIVIFHINEIAEYLDNAADFHNLTDETILEALGESSPEPVKQVFRPPISATSRLPVLEVEDRKRAVTEVGRFIRNFRFAHAIRSVYDRCATCGFQYDYILDAAHIVPVADGGTDTYDNGLGLCPNCHRMFDKGFILVDEVGRIHINTRYAEEYHQLGRAGSLETLRTTLREVLWLPEDRQYHPSPNNLRRTFDARR